MSKQTIPAVHVRPQPVTSNYCCPLCDSPLLKNFGDQMQIFPTKGVHLYCPSNRCPAQEVSGHGKNEAGAYNVIMAKFAGGKINQEVEDEPITLPVVEPEDVL